MDFGDARRKVDRITMTQGHIPHGAHGQGFRQPCAMHVEKRIRPKV